MLVQGRGREHAQGTQEQGGSEREACDKAKLRGREIELSLPGSSQIVAAMILKREEGRVKKRRIVERKSEEGRVTVAGAPTKGGRKRGREGERAGEED